MSGTSAGSKRSAQANKEKYGEDFYKRIGSIGGKASGTGGFGQGEEGRKRASIYGAIGGKISKRPKMKKEKQDV